MIVLFFQFPCYAFDIFSANNYCTTHNFVTVWDIFIKLYRNVDQVKTICGVQLLLISVSELWPFDCVLFLFCVIYIFVHPITHSLSMIIFMHLYSNLYLV